MSKELKKFNSLEELNGFIAEGKTLYSLANCGNIWFVEVETSVSSNTTNTVVDEFEDVIEKCIRLGYAENDRGAKKYYVSNWRGCCSVVSQMSESIKMQMLEFCCTYGIVYRGSVADTLGLLR